MALDETLTDAIRDAVLALVTVLKTLGSARKDLDRSVAAHLGELDHLDRGRREVRADERRRLIDPACPMDFPVLSRLKEEGGTDYLVVPMVCSDGEVNASLPQPGLELAPVFRGRDDDRHAAAVQCS